MRRNRRNNNRKDNGYKTLAVLYLILLIVLSLPAATEPQGGMPTMRSQPRSTMPYSIYEWH